MRIVYFSHSITSDWNHGNAHFLRGVVTELLTLGHDVRVYEPRDGFSVTNLTQEHGTRPFGEFRAAYPLLSSTVYELDELDLGAALAGADLVIVHEWNDPRLIARLSAHRAQGADYRLLFHDTHHRSASAPDEMGRFDLSGFDGALVFGRAIAERYDRRRWVRRVWVWHEAADTRVFRPRVAPIEGDLVWVGNWGDDERTAELEEFLLRPVRDLRLRASVYGVRYPDDVRRRLERAGIQYRGWLPNFRVPETFARHRATVHVPRRPYATALPGIPTIRVFEALACAIPLVSAPWEDAEGLFESDDLVFAHDGDEMVRELRRVLYDPAPARARAARARQHLRARHTCAHRAEELLRIADSLGKRTALPHAATPRRSATREGVA
jgi:spore maturation protein CgeB